MWNVAIKNVHCPNRQFHFEPDKLVCQKLCEQNENCIGVSHTDNELYEFTSVCFVCLDDSVVPNDYDFKLYRKPGMGLV